VKRRKDLKLYKEIAEKIKTEFLPIPEGYFRVVCKRCKSYYLDITKSVSNLQELFENGWRCGNCGHVNRW
jgi:RNase P subunit RPR2